MPDKLKEKSDLVKQNSTVQIKYISCVDFCQQVAPICIVVVEGVAALRANISAGVVAEIGRRAVDCLRFKLPGFVVGVWP